VTKIISWEGKYS